MTDETPPETPPETPSEASDSDECVGDSKRVDPPRPGRPIPSFRFDALCEGSKEIIIEFLGQQYRLRATRNGKLILNK